MGHPPPAPTRVVSLRILGNRLSLPFSLLPVIWREKSGGARPMLATLAEPPLTGTQLVFEPKYDGIRALVEIEPRPRALARWRDRVRVWSRLGNDKTSQFPSIVAALAAFGAAAREPLVVDGEIVALDAKGRPMGFQRLQGRIHLTDAKDVERIDREQPVALIAFDLLREGKDDLRGLPLVERRARLERSFGTRRRSTIRISEQVTGDGRALHARAQQEGWEGLIVKEAQSPYQSGRRSPTWRKLKLQHEQEFVVGGWTEPRNTRQHFGALLLGVYERLRAQGASARAQARKAGARSLISRAAGALIYVGHTGTGFDQHELERVSKLLKARADHAVAVCRHDQEQRDRALGAARARRAGAVHGVDRRRKAATSGVSGIAR